MPAQPSGPHLHHVTRRWHDLAERRLAYFIELYQSGRWTRYYTREQFATRMLDVIKVARVWGELAGRPRLRQAAGQDDGLRPAA